MSRQIKFRIWDKKRKEWVHDTEWAISLLGEVIICGEILRRPDDTHVKISELNDLIPMQFTGLKDSAGKEIFEGDIIENRELDNRQIMYCGNSFEMRLMNGKPDKDNCVWFYKVKVIGNIYQNLELLK